MGIFKLDRNKYLGEQITKEVVQNWIDTYRQTKKGMFVKIGCSTGNGKTFWTNNILGELIYENNIRLLYMSPRTSLNIQQVKDTSDKNYTQYFDIITTQAIQNMLTESENYIRPYEKENTVRKSDLPIYDIIVVDEAHLLINDSVFNQESLIVVDWLKKQNKIVILLSGTGYNLFNIPFSEDEINYKSDDDYSMVKEVIIANSDEQLITKTNEIYQNLGENEKILIVTEKLLTGTGQDTQLTKWSRTLPPNQVSFVYSKDNPKFKQFKEQYQEIEDGTFNGKVLIGTKKIAEGINITDDSCKYLVQNFADEDTHLQANGRVRNREGITIVVRAYNNMELGGKIRALNEKYGVALDCFGNEEKTKIVQLRFKHKMYGLPNGFYRNSDGIVQINYAEMMAVLDVITQYKYAISHEQGHCGVLKDLYHALKVPSDKIIDLDEVKEQITNEELIAYFEKSIEIKERFHTQEQKDYLIKLCNCRDKQGRLVKKPNAINKILIACHIPYEIKNKETSKMIDGKKTKIKYWTIQKVTE